MLQLDYHNILVQSILTERFKGDNTGAIDQTISDFDGVTLHISNPEERTLILISISTRCYAQLCQYGAAEYLQKIYGSYIVKVEAEYDFSLQIDLKAIPQERELQDELIMSVAMLKRHILAPPFETAFSIYDDLSKAAEKGGQSVPSTSGAQKVMAIPYREEEAIYVCPSHDRVTVIFSTVFREETDRVFGKVFLQEFVDARRRAIQNAPQVLFSPREPPLEIRGVPGLVASEGIAYVTFVFFPRHLIAARRQDCISQIQIFRDYFHFHIKCSKAYMHSRMRHRVSEYLKILNRAKPENADKERKTASGRTFVAAR